ncbi:MAG: hypothetical protein GW903_02105 [Alphaproteobacteria bacterium]|nr:hypothetical protein [Alphaproteobacteria bacterium]NCQ87764.1 hypothetical protein [Alphaproteobacteria bacterium]NCT05728.1 hypothetical protein [Alphaproteobacteria bacterium]
MFKIFATLAVFLSVLALPQSVLAQASASKEVLFERLKQRISERNPGVVPSTIGPVFFTDSEIELVRNARKGLVTRAPTPAELNELTGEETAIPLGPRNIKLGGIVYTGEKDWTIWLNNQQVRPNAIPSEVLDLNVYKEYIEIEWFDEYTNKIFPIRMRPNQTFNIDSRIFIPG